MSVKYARNFFTWKECELPTELSMTQWKGKESNASMISDGDTSRNLTSMRLDDNNLRIIGNIINNKVREIN